MSEHDLDRFPAWRQAVKDFLSTFKYGEMATHDWLESRFGMPSQSESTKLTPEAYRTRQFQWLANIEAFKTELLQEHQVCLQSVYGQGYRWLPPSEQTGFATKEFEKDIGRAFRSTGQRVKNVRLNELTDNERRANVDAAAKLAALRGMSRKELR